MINLGIPPEMRGDKRRGTMTPDEIRKWHDDLEGNALNKVEVIRARARIEIAAQLAELNQKLSRVISLDSGCIKVWPNR